MAWWKAVILGIVEGLTEFLPVSSTGHLIVAQDLLRFADEHEVFTFVIQLGAILAVVALYARRFLDLARDLIARKPAAWRFVLGIVVACIPAATVGLLLDDWVDAHLMSSGTVAISLAVGGFLILVIERGRREARHGDAWALPLGTAFAIGCCQLLAMIPGVSRSGATILGGICFGASRQAATEFSFFLAIPVMLGISALKLVKHREHLDDQVAPIAIGFVVSFVVALVAIRWLLRYVATHDFKVFGWYRIAAGLVLGAMLALGWLKG